MWVYEHECFCLWRPEVSDPLEREFQKAVSLLMWVLGVNLGPLAEQKVLLTAEPSHRPLGDKFGFS